MCQLLQDLLLLIGVVLLWRRGLHLMHSQNARRQTRKKKSNLHVKGLFLKWFTHVCTLLYRFVRAARSPSPDRHDHHSPGPDPHTPSVLWNAMIYPLLNMTIKGAIWYQGEANAGMYLCVMYCACAMWYLLM